jgi:hypothetical protein
MKIDKFFNMPFDDFIIAVPMWVWLKSKRLALGKASIISFEPLVRILSKERRINEITVATDGFRKEWVFYWA